MDDNMKALEDLEDVMRQMDTNEMNTNEVRILRQEVETVRAQMSTMRAQISMAVNIVESLLDRELAPRSNEEQEYVPAKVSYDPAVG